MLHTMDVRVGYAVAIVSAALNIATNHWLKHEGRRMRVVTLTASRSFVNLVSEGHII